MTKMRILVVGSGGREHALVEKIGQSPLVGAVYCAPGNAGISKQAACVDIAQHDIAGLLTFVRKKEIDFTVVGAEAPLANGIVDEFEAQGLHIFGPSAKAAEIESSKVFSKYLMQKYNIPTAACEVFDDYGLACDYLEGTSYPVVVKADGLAAGKGAFVCQNQGSALAALKQIMVDKAFGTSGNKVIVEEFMRGEEVSVIAVTDGETLAYLPSAQDHKAIFDNDQGPNTGGMGAYAPAPVMTSDLLQSVDSEIMQPALKGMALEGRPFRGFLYAGLMITREGPKVIEFNCRLGDPEAQAILPLVESDLVDAMFRVATGKRVRELKIGGNWALCVVIASGGYPDNYKKNRRVLGLDKNLGSDIHVFHAGTSVDESGHIVTAGGRVLGVTAVADNFHSARERAYWALGKITFDGAYYRKDIGGKALKHIRNQGKKIEKL